MASLKERTGVTKIELRSLTADEIKDLPSGALTDYQPKDARLAVKQCSHDFGTYYDVVCYFDSQNPTAYNFALLCESDAPVTWAEARRRPSRSGCRTR